MLIRRILPGAWELTGDVQTQLFALHVPTAWRQVAQALTDRRARGGYRGIPVRSLDSVMGTSFPQIIHTERKSWKGQVSPWVFATDRADLSELPFLVRSWLMEEFGWCIGDAEVESALSRLQDSDWEWSSRIYSPNDIPYQAIPDYLAQKFLENPNVTFGAKNQYPLTFYRVTRFEKGAELMSWPPTPIPVGKGMTSVSFVIHFTLQTVPWREAPLIYHALSVRRWVTKPLIKETGKGFPYGGVTAYIGDTRRWLDGAEQPFSFVTLRMERWDGELHWCPQAIAELLRDAGRIPDPLTLASNPAHNWHQFDPASGVVQAAVAYSTRQGKHPCLPGVSPLDLARLDQAIAQRLPLVRVAEGVKVAPQSKQQSFWSTGKSTPMLRPEIAGPATSAVLKSQPTVLILWETEACRDALISELCRVLSLSSTPQENIYEGSYGSLCILTQHVGVMGELLDVGDFKVSPRVRHQQRVELLEERILLIADAVPKVEELKGALVEIVRSPSKLYPRRVPESDPKLAWRVGLAQAGYVNQHLHALSENAEVDTDVDEELPRGARAEKERRKQAASDLLRQWGVLPDSLINPKTDGIESSVWLACFSILQRNRRTTVRGVPHTAAIMVRVNPVTGDVQVTTPMLRREEGWVSYPEGLKHLVSERWEPESWFEESDDESREQKALLSQFVAQCLRDCLDTQIGDVKSPRVLFMAEAQNTRRKLPWLNNSNLLNLLVGELPNELKLHVKDEKEQNRLWIVRLRVADDIEVPSCIAKNSEGSRANGVFQWQGVCDDARRALYLSIGKLPNSAKFILRRAESRLESAKRPAGNARPLEIAVVHHPGIESDQLAHFVHSLRQRWPYFADAVSLPLPFPFATKAKEYAVSARDNAEALEFNDAEN